MGPRGYDIKATIAHSEHATISRAIRTKDGRPVVLKRLSETYPPLTVARRLEFEHRILCKLQVPGVIEVLELCDDDGRPALVLEDFGAENLALPPGQCLPLSEFFDAAIAAARALGEIHARGVIHKDIKPHNLVMNRKSGVLKLIDFQLATELSRESQGFDTASRLEGSLPYISPEQTGRMNRALDYRSDYYSLGVTFFELLTGRLPFEASDVMGWVHAHISRPPPEARAVHPAIPSVVSRIVQRLMAKDADARYQSARGLIADLERCKQHWNSSQSIPEFELGEADVSERFQVSQRLIGRESEARTLLDVFEQASHGPARLLLVSGYSGVGKSSLIREIHKPITEKNGNFVSGKFDQLDRNVPYGALLQALRQLVRQLLPRPESELNDWKGRILAALGSNARIMIDLIPELQHILGQQPPAPELNSSEAQNRFKRVVGQFLRLFARREQPLVIFLDDLQWTDASTPDLVADLLSKADVQHLLIVGAYRSNEVQEGHLLPLAVKHIRDVRPDAVHEVVVAPLTLPSITALVADSLRQPFEAVRALAELVFDKTAGNPFFATELLGALYRSGAIGLNAERGVWECDLEQARRASVSDNVVDLMLARLRELPREAARALSVAACVNSRFELHALAQLLDQSAARTAGLLWAAADRGLITPLGDSYRLTLRERAEAEPPAAESSGADALSVSYQFQHDRVQQAAYSLIEHDQRAAMHLRIGRKLLAELGDARVEEQLFELANHLNLGRSLIVEPAERERLAHLNVRAARKARQSTAYSIASQHLDIAIELLPSDTSARRAEHFDLYRQRVEVVLMAGATARATALCAELFEIAPDPLAQSAVYLLEARILEAEARFVDSVQAVRKGLALLGIELPADPEHIGQQIGAGIGRMQGHLGKMAVERLLELPDMTDPAKVMAMNLLFQSIPAAIQTCPPLFILAELTMFDLAVEHGLTPACAKNFVDCGIIQGGIIGDYETAYRLGKLAFRVLERFDARAIASSVNFVFATYVSSWRAAPEEALEAFQECYRVGMDTGDVQHMGFGTALRMHRLLHLGHDLNDCGRELEVAIAFLERSRLPSQRTAVVLAERAIARLCAADASAEQLAQADELATEQVLSTGNPQWIYAYGESQMMVSILLGDFTAAERWRQVAAPHVVSATALISVPEYHLAEALILARHQWRLGGLERSAILDQLREIRSKLETWSKNCASNFAHKYHLVAAELARLEGEPLSRILEHYQAAASTTGSAYIQMRALALELQAQFWAEQGNELFCQALLEEATHLYERWGASVKVKRLRAQGGKSFERPAATRITTSTLPRSSASHSLSRHGLASGALDLTSVVKATQAISSEVKNDQLFARLLSILLENAGAQRGSLILCQDGSGELSVEARADLSGPTRVGTQPLEGAEHVCVDIVRYALRSGEPLVIDDASLHPQFSRDAYVRESRVKSVLCLPITNQGKLVAAFYAENAMTSHAFSPDRVATLRLIGAQAAISIVNARLYENLEAKVTERTQELAAKNREILAMLDGMDQGVFSIDDQLRIQPQYSRQLPSLLGAEEPAGQAFAPLLFDGSDVGKDAQSATETALRFCFGATPELATLNLGHLVQEFSKSLPGGGVRHFEVAWNPITGTDGTVVKFLIVVRDVTLLRRLRQAEGRAAREAEIVTGILSAGVDEFRGFCESARRLLRAGRGLSALGRELGPADAERLFRDLHTIKGNARTLGMSELVDEAHAAESLLDRRRAETRSDPDWPETFARLEKLETLIAEHEDIGRRKLGPLWTGESRRLEEALAQIEAALDGARAHPSQPAPALAEIQRTVRRINAVTWSTLVQDTARIIPSLAAELGKPAPRVECSDDGHLLAPVWARVVKDAFAHVLRNAVDHGLESAAERRAQGKPPEGRILLRTEHRDGRLRIHLADDGRGLPLHKLREQSSLAAAPDETIAERIFASGVSTAAHVSQISGRGVGLDAVRSMLVERGANVSVAFTGEERSGYRPFELVFDLPSSALLD